MKIGIICAGDRELEPFLAIIEDCAVSQKAMLKFYEGTISGMSVVVLYSGVCKVNAAIATQILIDKYKTDVIINFGTAGGMNPELDLFDVVVSTETVYHDVAPNILTEFHPWLDTIYFHADKELLAMTKTAAEKADIEGQVFYGRMVTGEAFITDDGREEINNSFAPLTVDMETASIAHVCYVNDKPFISIRCITDTADHSGADCFLENCPKAATIARNVVVALINEICESI